MTFINDLDGCTVQLEDGKIPAYAVNCDFINTEPANISVLKKNFLGNSSPIYLTINNANIETILPGAFNVIDKLPLFSPHTFIHISLSNNSIKEIKKGIFDVTYELRELDLSFNNITDIEKDAFGTTILKLNLNNNKLKQIPEDLFNKLTSLRELHLGYNEITSLGNDTFRQNIYLKILNINNNKITIISPELFSYNLHLNELDISSNPILNVNEKIFTQFEYLRKLDISYTETNNTLLNMSKYNTFITNAFYARGNHINAIYLNNKNIVELSLSNNNLTKLYNVSFKNCSYLSLLDLSFNKISEIEQNTFLSLVSLEALHLNNNELRNLSHDIFNNLKNLNHLDISSNFLTSLSYENMHFLSNLYFLDVSSNRISHLKTLIFRSLGKLKHLFLHNNKLKQLDSEALTTYLPLLEILSLDGNKWHCNTLHKIIITFEKKYVQILPGNSLSVHAILGINCKEENELVNVNENQLYTNNLNNIYNKSFKKSNDEFEIESEPINHTTLIFLTVGIYILIVLLVISICFVLFTYLGYRKIDLKNFLPYKRMQTRDTILMHDDI